MKSSYSPHHIHRLRALRDWILIEDMNFDERITTGGIILTSDNGKGTGIRPRWGRIYTVGPEQLLVHVGQWILVAHGRWTRGVEIEDNNGKHTIRRIDPDDILLVSDDRPSDDTMSDAIHIDAKSN